MAINIEQQATTELFADGVCYWQVDDGSVDQTD